jgi:hypothetical protein
VLRIEVEFTDKGKWENLIRYIENDLFYGEMQIETQILAHHTADFMREIINTERKNPVRPDHKLENAITAEPINETGGIMYGIGEIAKLRAEAPYFELINDGGTYVTKRTHIVPTTYFSDPGTGFITFKEGSSHTIEGINYVGRAIQNLDKELKELVLKLGGQWLSEMEKQ